jgi:hypothetical protein
LALSGSTATAVDASPWAAPSIGTQLAILKGSDTVGYDYFGYKVAISGTTAVVGADSYRNSAGRAYVFTETATGWKQASELEGSDTVTGDDFGSSVAISGTTAVVGADGYGNSAGRAYVFTKTAGTWTQVAELKGSDTTAGDSFGQGDQFGQSVAISGTTAIVGAEGHDYTAGRAYLFTKTATGWRQTAELKAGLWEGRDLFKFVDSVAISGTTVMVGAPSDDNLAGRAYVFEA